MKAIPNSNPEKAIINVNGNKPKKKNMNPEFIMLYVNPLKIFNNIWPDKIFAAKRNPKDTLRAKYDINSINTNKGNRPNGQPEGTNNEKNLVLWYINPNIVAPNTIVKLSEKVNTKWLVEAKL